MAKRPEHEKLKAVQNEVQAIGSFLDWLADVKGIELATRHKHNEHCYGEVQITDRDFTRRRMLCGYMKDSLEPAGIPFRKLIAEFFNIDEDKLEKEKRAMLDEIVTPKPPWTVFSNSQSDPARPGKCLVVIPAGRPGEVANVERVPDGVVLEVVKSVNESRMTVEQAMSVFEFWNLKAQTLNQEWDMGGTR